MKMLMAFSFVVLLAAIARIDFLKKRIPDFLTAGVGLVGLIALHTIPQPGTAARVAGVFAVSLPLFLIACLRPRAFGGGDIKLMAAGGLFLGVRMILLSFVLAMLGSGVYSVFLLLKGEGKERQFAMGPFLCAGMAVSCFWGERIWQLL